jgi:hypothetical protein
MKKKIEKYYHANVFVIWKNIIIKIIIPTNRQELFLLYVS